LFREKIKALSAFILLTVFLLTGCASTPTPAPVIQTPVNIYRYDQAPYFWFFPKAWAKWDGYKITNKNWNQLSDYQKLKFILEGIQEIEGKQAVAIKINDGPRAIVALNYSAAKINREIPKTEISMLSFLYAVLKEAKMVAPRKVKAGKKQRR